MFNWFKKKRTAEPTTTIATATTTTDTPAPVAKVVIPHDKIVARAYEIWVRKGKPHGKDFENWSEAEAELRAEAAANPRGEPLPNKPR